MNYKYYTKKEDKTGIYLLTQEHTNQFDGYKPQTTYRAKIGMSYVGACQRAKHQSHERRTSRFLPVGKFTGQSITTTIEVEDVRYFPNSTRDEIITIEQNCHNVMKKIGKQIETSEWYIVPYETYLKLKKVGITLIFSEMPKEELLEIINIARS